MLSETVDTAGGTRHGLSLVWSGEPLLGLMQHGRWAAQTVHDVNVDGENRSERGQSEDGRIESYGNRMEIDRRREFVPRI